MKSDKMLSNVLSVVLFIGQIYEVDLSIYPTGAILVTGNYTRCEAVDLHMESSVREIRD